MNFPLAGLCVLLAVSEAIAGPSGSPSPANCLECDRALRKSMEALQAWRRLHNGSYPTSLAAVHSAGLAGFTELGCPGANAERPGMTFNQPLSSSRREGGDRASVYEYELMDTPAEGLAGVWFTEDVPTRRTIKSILLRRPFNEQVPLLRCSSHKDSAPDGLPDPTSVWRNATAQGLIYWSGKYWEDVWLEDVPMTSRLAFVAAGQPGPPFFTSPVPENCGFIDISQHANAFPQYAWWWGVPFLPAQPPVRLPAPHLKPFLEQAVEHRISLNSISYWIDGIIALQGKVTPETKSYDIPGRAAFPGRRNHIPVHRKLSAAHWLQGTAFLSEKGQTAGSLIWHYENGETETTNIIYGVNTARFWGDAASLSREKEFGEPVWSMDTAATGAVPSRTLRLYSQTWRNPHPDQLVSTVDFISNQDNTASPFLIAITTQP